MIESPLLRIIGPGDLPKRSRAGVDPPTLAEAGRILDDVRSRGEAALLSHAERLGDWTPPAPHIYEPGQLAAALDRLPLRQREVLERTAARIRAFALAQRDCLKDLSFPIPGGSAGHTSIPVDTAGCYIPGGRFPLPSSALMTVITARAAGVRTVWAASPRPTDVTLAAAAIAGADGLLGIGGAQAVGALAYGVGAVPACDMIVGPGNRWVTAAKQLVSASVGIDMLAGPSELVVLADESADPSFIAADLLAQAEHDTDAVPILITTSGDLASAVATELARQIETLPTRDTAGASLRANGFAVVTSDLNEAVATCNRLAPEHLQVMTRNSDEVAARIRHCGGVFIGESSAEVFGDYGAGPNHVLPTAGTARFRAGLSVSTFLRTRTWLRIENREAAAELAADAAALARLERLEGHARAAEMRQTGRRGG